MCRNVIWMLAILLVLAGIDVRTLKAEDTTEPGKIALSEVAPELYFQMRRYPKFYGDPNTTHGSLVERSFLFDNFGGARDSMTDHGIYLDVSLTQFFHGNVAGGKNDNAIIRNEGKLEYWLTLDSGKAGLWSGGALFVHAETSWQADRSINPDTGSLLPANFDAAMPTPGVQEDIALPEFYLVQALPADMVFIMGKVDFAGLGDTNLFANNERTQFSYTGLVNNPILGAFIPYTSWGAALAWAPSKQHALTVLGVQAKGNATTSGFDNFNGKYTIGGQYQFSPTLGGGTLPGHYIALVGYSNKDVTNYDIDSRHLIGEIIGIIPIDKKSSNYAGIVNFDQFLWVKENGNDAGREKLPPVGIGIFGRAGWVPKDRNVIDQFYSFGLGGYGMLIPGRDNDRWGVGWAGTHISSDLRNDARLLEIDIDRFENGFEAFYNVEFTPAVHFSLNLQIMNSVDPTVDTATTLGTRLQVDF